MIKCTIHRKTIRSKREVVSTLGMEPLMARIRDDAKKKETVEALRTVYPPLLPSFRLELTNSLPLICPGLEAHKRRSGEVEMRYNGVALLEVSDLDDDGITEVKQKVAAWPTTLAAMTGASGKSVKILVRGTCADGTLPSEATVAGHFHHLLYERCAAVYSAVIGKPLKSKSGEPSDTFRWTWDPEAFYNPEASALRIQPQDLAQGVAEKQDRSREYGEESIVPSTKTRHFYEMRFALAVKKMNELWQEHTDKDAETERGRGKDSETEKNREKDAEAKRKGGMDAEAERKGGKDAEAARRCGEEQFALIVEECIALGMPIEETLYQAQYWAFTHLDSRERAREIAESIYLAHPLRPTKNHPHGMQELTMMLQAFMNQRYDLRFNELTNSVEWRPNHSNSYVFRPLDTRVMNTMIQEAHEHGIEVFDRDMRRFLGSTRIRSYNTAQAYLREVKDKWDGKTDHIGALADRVPNRNPHWREWFHTWFLGMVAQWEEFNTGHGNAVVPLLIGLQGCGKSTFGQFILPPELRGDGYRELVDFSSKQEVERMLTSSLLINLDEFNQISEKLQQGFLKNLLQKSSVKMRRPYSSAISELPRRASFIATTNMNDVLADPSGSRRFIVAEIREGQLIDLRSNIRYEELYSQALRELYPQPRRCYFTPEEVQQIEAYNAAFANQRPEVEYLLDVFEPVADGKGECEWLSTTEIANEVRRQTHFEYSNRSLNYLGRWLTSEARAMRLSKKLSHGIAIYSLRRRKKGVM